MGPDHRRRGAPGKGATQRLGETDPRAALASPAAAHGHPGGEPAAGSLRDGEPRRARPAGHVRAVPSGARRGRCRAGPGAAERACPPEADRRGDDQAPAERGQRAAAAAPGRDLADRAAGRRTRLVRRSGNPDPRSGRGRRAVTASRPAQCGEAGRLQPGGGRVPAPEDRMGRSGRPGRGPEWLAEGRRAAGSAAAVRRGEGTGLHRLPAYP